MGGSWWSIILEGWGWVGKYFVGWRWLEMSRGERGWVGVSGNFFLFFLSLVVYLTLALNSPVKSYSLIHANKKIHINKAKNTIECFLHIFT